jgi:hypothetical protein
VTRRGLLLGLLALGCAGRAPHSAGLLPHPAPVPIMAPLALRDLAVRPIPPAADRSVTVCAGGDVMLGSNLDSAWLRAVRISGSPTLLPDPDTLLAPLAPLVGDADVVLLNVEGAIGRGPAPSKCRPGSTRCYAFRQDPAVAGALRRIAPHAEVAGNVANNHAMDAGASGFIETVRHLREARVHPVGMDTLPAVVPFPTGDTLAILGFSVFRAGPDARDLAGVARHVARAAQAYRWVVVSLHIGAEGRDAQRTPDATERFAGEDRGNPVAIARTAVESGADLVVGHGPHVLRAIEWQGRSLVAYSLGNLATYGPFSREPPLDRGAVLCAVLDPGGGVKQAELRATHQERPGLPYPDPRHTAFDLVDSLGALDFPATAARISAGMVRRPR